MKGQIYKRITTTVVAAAIIAAALTSDTADAISVCAQEVSSGDSEIQETPNNDNTGEAEAPEENVQEPEVPAEIVPESEAPEESAQEPEITAEPMPLAEPESVSAITVKGTPDTTYVYDGQEHSFQITLDSAGVDADGVSYDITATGTQTVTAKNVSQNSFEITDLSGITVCKAGTTEAVAPSSLIVSADVITKRTVTVRSMNLVKTYDGNPLENNDTPLAEESGWVEGEGANYTFTGSRTSIGTDINAFTATSGKDGTDLNNYNIVYVYGAITVVERLDDQKYIITVEAVSTKTKYSGQDQGISGYVLEGRSDADFQVNGTGDASEVLSVTIGNATFSVTGIAASTTGKNAGTYTVNIVGSPVIRDSEGTDVTSQFKFEFKPGTLEIEKRKVVLTSGSLTKKFNGKTIKKHEVTVSGDGFVEGEGATYTFTGKQKEVGESYNYFSYKLNEGTLEENYDIEKVPGKLKVKKADDEAINEEPKNNDSGNANSGEAQQENNTASEGSTSTAQVDTAQANQPPAPDNPNVLGANRGTVTVDIVENNVSKKSKKGKKKKKKSKENVLGARRGSTDDSTHMDRHLMVFIAAVVFMSALKIKRKKSIKK